MTQKQVKRVYDSLYNRDYFGVAKVFMEAGDSSNSERLLEAVLDAQTDFSVPDAEGNQVLCDSENAVYSLSLKTEIEDCGVKSNTLLRNNSEQVLVLYVEPSGT